jgi:RNA polymerase sigma factor (sigma-70 family)
MDEPWKTRKTLIERVASNCERSWEEFHRIYVGFVASIASKFGIPSGEVDDVSQNIFLEVYRDLRKDDAPDFRERSFGAWLGQKVKWRVLEYHRHRHRREHATDPESSCGRPFEPLWEAEWQRRVLEVALQRVEETPRNLLIYQALAIQEMSVTEVCEMFGISRSNADTIKNRVKNKLLPVIREIEAGDL